MNQNNKYYFVNLKILNNRLNQSFTYMIDLSLYNELKYADLVLVKFNKRLNIGFVIEKNVSNKKPGYKINEVIKILKKANFTDQLTSKIDYMERICYANKEDVTNYIYSKNEPTTPKLIVELKVDLQQIQRCIDVFSRTNKIKNKSYLENYFLKNEFNYSQIKAEHLSLFEYLDEEQAVSIKLNSSKQKKIILYNYQNNWVSKDDLKNKYGLTTYKINKLIKEEKFDQREINKSDYISKIDIKKNTIHLTSDQQEAFESINKGIKSKPVLLRGVTGSGKTALFIKQIQKHLNEKTQVLLLVPEITLAKQIIDELISQFGNICGYYSGDLTSRRKLELLDQIKKEHIRIIVGTRSSIFLDIPKLSLVIVDEEHDNSYKQSFYPYYYVHDFIDYWSQNKINVLLASATPTITSYTKASKGLYHLVELKSRYKNYSQAKIKFKQFDQDNIINEEFINNLKTSISNNEKVLILFNAIGYSRTVECNICKHVPKCPHCSIPLKYFKETNSLECSHCKHTKRNYVRCEDCGSNKLNYIGIGIEKIQEQLTNSFPNNVLKIDSKTAKTKVKVNEIIKDFNNSNNKILIGTQIISKGLNFKDLNKVIILNLDSMLFFNDFVAYEKTYQLVEQVSGRSGRSTEEGQVIIYTNHRDNYIYKSVKNHDYLDFYKEELHNRKLQKVLPFYNIAQIEARSTNEQSCINVLEKMNEKLSSEKLLVTFVEKPYIQKIGDKYRYKFFVKYKKENIKEIIQNVVDETDVIGVEVLVDLNAQSFGY